MPEILGRLRPPRLAGSAPATPAKGEMYMDTTTNILYWWNGTVWVSSSSEVNVSTAGPSPRIGELLWVDTDDPSQGSVGAAGGDLSGTFPNPTVVMAGGKPIHVAPVAGVAKTINMGVTTVALGAFAGTSMAAALSGSIAHGLGVIPVGIHAQIIPGAGDRLGSVPISNIETKDVTNFTCRHNNASQPVIAIGAGTVTIAWLVWA